jgi:hypothetical protein
MSDHIVHASASRSAILLVLLAAVACSPSGDVAKPTEIETREADSAAERKAFRQKRALLQAERRVKRKARHDEYFAGLANGEPIRRRPAQHRVRKLTTDPDGTVRRPGGRERRHLRESKRLERFRDGGVDVDGALVAILEDLATTRSQLGNTPRYCFDLLGERPPSGPLLERLRGLGHEPDTCRTTSHPSVFFWKFRRPQPDLLVIHVSAGHVGGGMYEVTLRDGIVDGVRQAADDGFEPESRTG